MLRQGNFNKIFTVDNYIPSTSVMYRLSAFIFLIVFTVPNIVFAQNSSNSKLINDRVNQVPDSLKDYQDIADFLCSELPNEREKLAAIHSWIGHNIRYDYAQLKEDKHFETKEDLITDVLNTRQAVCEGYSRLFDAMCKSQGIKSFYISGYSRKKNGETADVSHAWNGVWLTSGEYLMVDVTWDAGYVEDGEYVFEFFDFYFLNEPKDFIKTHVPFDPIWQFLETPISHADLLKNDFDILNFEGSFNFKDSINLLQELDEFTSIQNKIRRIKTFGVTNHLIEEQLTFLEKKLNYLETCKAVDVYNEATKHLNSAVNQYNLYNKFKERKFRKPKVSDGQILNMIDNITSEIITAQDLARQVSTTDEEITRDRDKILRVLGRFEEEILIERRWINKHLAKWRPFRG